MRMKKWMTIASIAAAASGCATLPPTEQMKSETASYQLPKLPDTGKAVVYVVRPASIGGFIRFNVFVDDEQSESEMGYTRSREYIYFTVPAGYHKIFSKAENWAEMDISVKAGDIIFIQQEPEMGLIMARNSLLKLDDLAGKYDVKTLTLGTIKKSGK
jgi:hypothetical protein